MKKNVILCIHRISVLSELILRTKNGARDSSGWFIFINVEIPMNFIYCKIAAHGQTDQRKQKRMRKKRINKWQQKLKTIIIMGTAVFNASCFCLTIISQRLCAGFLSAIFLLLLNHCHSAMCSVCAKELARTINLENTPAQKLISALFEWENGIRRHRNRCIFHESCYFFARIATIFQTNQ